MRGRTGGQGDWARLRCSASKAADVGTGRVEAIARFDAVSHRMAQDEVSRPGDWGLASQTLPLGTTRFVALVRSGQFRRKN